jgi:hypothetical protein
MFICFQKVEIPIFRCLNRNTVEKYLNRGLFWRKSDLDIICIQDVGISGKVNAMVLALPFFGVYHCTKISRARAFYAAG